VFTEKAKNAEFDSPLEITNESTHEDIMASLSKEFSPEFRNRIDEFVFFNSLTEKNILDIAELHLKKYPIRITPEIVEFVASNGFSKEFGARNLIRFIKKNIGIPIANTIISDKVPFDGLFNYEATIKDNKLEIVNIA